MFNAVAVNSLGLTHKSTQMLVHNALASSPLSSSQSSRRGHAIRDQLAAQVTSSATTSNNNIKLGVFSLP
jgi:hypothetical protein